MDGFWIIAVAIGAIVALLVMFRRGKGDGGRRNAQYRQRNGLFSAAERSFIGVLDQAVAGRYRVFGKVRIADVLTPVTGLEKGEWTRLFNRIKAKHFDFVLCDPKTLKVIAVIELNDKSHGSQRGIARDELVGQACADAGLILKMVKAQKSYSVETVRMMIDEIDGRKSFAVVAADQKGTGGVPLQASS